MRIKFDKEPLAIEQKNYLTKLVNAYIRGVATEGEGEAGAHASPPT